MRWLLDPGLLSAFVLVSALLYAVGLRRRLATGRRRRQLVVRAALFAAALVLVDLTLSPAFDRYADESLTVHMLQHVVLMTVVPPLVVLAAPWLTIWRACERVVAIPSRYTTLSSRRSSRLNSAAPVSPG